MAKLSMKTDTNPEYANKKSKSKTQIRLALGFLHAARHPDVLFALEQYVIYSLKAMQRCVLIVLKMLTEPDPAPEQI